MVDTLTHTPEGTHLFTCISCSIAFTTGGDQREHYRSDHHRYNMKRRVAGLPPVSASVFNQKVLDRRAETAAATPPKGSVCEVCNKVYTTENSYRSHINSKKHKENEIKALPKASGGPSRDSPSDPAIDAKTRDTDTEAPIKALQSISLTVDSTESEDGINRTIDEKIAAARNRLGVQDCLFCPVSSPDIAGNLTHMSTTHGFFIPDAEYLVDLPGLITYLGEKVAVGNVCIYCNGKGREFRSLDAVRKHMVDKSHCKIAYDNEKDRLEISDWYDFSSSYPSGPRARKGKGGSKHTVTDGTGADDDEWEEADDIGEEADEVVEENSENGSLSEDESIEDNQITYGDSPFELVLPSGSRIGHRSMKRYYDQSFPTRPISSSQRLDPNSGAGLVRRLLADRNSALVPRKGGFGAFGTGMEVVKARNVGEAKDAGKHIREFRDSNRREQFKTQVAFRHNNQKHFRDPLLQ